MAAPARDANDVPDRPYFVNQSVQEDDEEEEPVVYSIPKPKPAPKAAEPIVPRVPITPRQPITPTYRPAFMPPKPQTPAAKPAEKPKVDLSHVGTGLLHICR